MVYFGGLIRDVTYFIFGLSIGILIMLLYMNNIFGRKDYDLCSERFRRNVKGNSSEDSETVWPATPSDEENKNSSMSTKNASETSETHKEKLKHNSTESHNSTDEKTLDKVIYENVRILCWIMTHPNNTYKRAIHVNETWGKKCTKIIFVSADPKSGLPIVDLNFTAGYKYLWQKTKKTLAYLYKTELDNYDWFLKADDDTYVIMENLRFMLLAYPSSIPVYFGCKFKPYVKQGYMSGGAGYVLSRRALKDFNEKALNDPTKCKSDDTGNEDLEVGKCLQNAGVIAGDSRDRKGRHRMFPLSPSHHFHGNNATGKSLIPKWVYQYMYYPLNNTKECCSETMISFHYVTPQLMYTLHNFLYFVQPFGLNRDKYTHSLKKNENPLEFAKKLSRLNAHKLTPSKEMQLFSNKASPSGKHEKIKHSNPKNESKAV
uniref:Glycoprotein-N-acetylgalactosamine 3-beta-galactosyltransferase 1 n=1 Tax=Strongyloides venezuelensis TaxID=75913 RepID=A0A0K0EUU4_STRVS